MIQRIKEIAIAAGDEIMQIYDSESFTIAHKEDRSPLTSADTAANKVICQGLEALDVKYPIVSEENKMIPYAERKNYSHYWCVDPLDGTKEFLKRNGEFTVNIALIHEGRPILGVVYVPAQQTLYWAQEGKGAFRQNPQETKRIEAQSFGHDQEGLRIVCSRSHLNEATQAFLDQYQHPTRINCGSSLKFLKISEGEADLYPRLAPTMEWDTAAAQIILEESGGKVIEWETKSPMRYNKESLLNPFFVAKGLETD